MNLRIWAGLVRVLPLRWRRWGAYAGSLGVIALDVVALCAVVVPYYIIADSLQTRNEWLDQS